MQFHRLVGIDRRQSIAIFHVHRSVKTVPWQDAALHVDARKDCERLCENWIGNVCPQLTSTQRPLDPVDYLDSRRRRCDQILIATHRVERLIAGAARVEPPC